MFVYKHGDRPLEGYTILRGLGRGGFGEVYYARSDGGREVALKVIQQNHDIELRGVGHCMNLKSPHLVTIFDVKRNDSGLPFVIMEFVSGPSIRDLVRENPGGLGVSQAVYLTLEIARGLRYLHDAGIVHRDLKPENLFVEGGFVKIGDYGLSKYISVSRHSGQTISVGTIHYMAPEIGSGNYHRGIDIYALGVIFYELLTGRVPFDGDSMGEILMKHLSVEADVSAIPDSLQPIVLRALAKRPDDRYATADQLIEDLEAIPEIARAMTSVDLSGIVSAAARPLEERETLGTSPAEGPAAVSTPVAPRSPSSPSSPPSPSTPDRATPSAPVEVGGEHAPAASGDAATWQQRLTLGISTAVAMSLGIRLVLGGRDEVFLPLLLTILAGATAVLLVGCYIAPRLRVEPGFGRRLINVAVAFPLLMLARLPMPSPVDFFHRSVPVLSLFAAMLLVDWHDRLREGRREQISLQQAILAAIFGGVAAMLLHENALTSAGILAGMSLVVNALAPYTRRPRGSRQRGPSPGAGPGRPTPSRTAPRSRSEPAPPADSPAASAPAGPTLGARFMGARSPLESGLFRPRVGAVFAGVCAGIARRYRWEVVWVRLVFALAILLSFGYGFLVYLILWLSMPSESSLSLAARGLARARETARRTRGTTRGRKIARGILLALSVLLASAGLSAILFVFVEYHGRMVPQLPGELATMYVPGLFCVYLSLALIFLGLTRGRLSSRRILLTLPTLVVALTAGTTSVLYLDLSSGHAQAHGESVVALFVALGSLFVTICMIALLRRGLRRSALDAAAAAGGYPGPGGGGFLHLAGSVFTLAALLSLVVGALVAVGIGDPVLRELDVPGALRAGIASFARNHYHFLLSALLFLPGVLLLLLARKQEGAAHVVRGAAGWLTLCLLTAMVALRLPEVLRFSAIDSRLIWAPPGAGVGSPRLEFVATLFLGVLAALLLAWPSRGSRVSSDRASKSLNEALRG